MQLPHAVERQRRRRPQWRRKIGVSFGCFPNQVVNILIIFGAHILKEFGIRHESQWIRDGPWFRVCTRIIDGGLQSDVSEIEPSPTLSHAQLFSVWMATGIEPAF